MDPGKWEAEWAALPHGQGLTAIKRGTDAKEEKAAFCRDFIKYLKTKQQQQQQKPNR